ncbi:MAG: LacI family DNA-binding transcriptional regulator [Opitutales bacterium]|nr:LacI family DNA-binding transcriptional regulator [Opitutales bacterium]MBT5166929.1 LacI family DNA-binding transcriptional regulator [Opitutales bacterium]MBT5813097.1 LacI family DNA-binding transcriptional regulator [Opitutales bacterium]
MKQSLVQTRSEKPTVVDVAREASVALGTVSRVLNSPDLVTEDIRQRVLEAIDRLGYQPLRRKGALGSSAKKASPKRRLGTIGLLLIGMDDSLTHLPVITEAIHGVELAVAAADESLMLSNVPSADRVPAFLAKNMVDGLVIKSPLLGDLRSCASRELVEAIERFPHIWLIGQPDSAGGDVVASDNEEGARIAAEYLFYKNHRRIAYLHPRPGQTRSEGLKQAFANHAERLGMHLSRFEGERLEKVVWPLPAITKTTDLEPLLDQWSAMSNEERPTAIMVGADSIAVQLYAAMQKRGLQVGKDVSVLSFNHEKPLMLALHPSLTTIDIQAEAIGKRSVDQLRWRIEHPEDSLSCRLLIAPRLVEGESVADLNA